MTGAGAKRVGLRDRGGEWWAAAALQRPQRSPSARRSTQRGTLKCGDEVSGAGVDALGSDARIVRSVEPPCHDKQGLTWRFFGGELSITARRAGRCPRRAHGLGEERQGRPLRRGSVESGCDPSAPRAGGFPATSRCRVVILARPSANDARTQLGHRRPGPGGRAGTRTFEPMPIGWRMPTTTESDRRCRLPGGRGGAIGDATCHRPARRRVLVAAWRLRRVRRRARWP